MNSPLICQLLSIIYIPLASSASLELSISSKPLIVCMDVAHTHTHTRTSSYLTLPHAPCPETHTHTHTYTYIHTHSWTCRRMCSQGWSWLAAWIGAAGSESSSMPAMLLSTGKPSTTLDLTSKAWTWKRSNGFGVE